MSASREEPLKSWNCRCLFRSACFHRTRPEVVEAIDGLLDSHDYSEIVDILNARGLRSGDGREFNVSIVGSICVRRASRLEGNDCAKEVCSLSRRWVRESASGRSQLSSGANRDASLPTDQTTRTNIYTLSQHPSRLRRSEG